MAHKMPAGAKHSPCVTHVPHVYPKSGWLCVTTSTEDMAWPASRYVETRAVEPDPAHGVEGKPAIVRAARDVQPVDRAADMLAFADHLVEVVARHRAAELTRPLPDGTAKGDKVCRKAGCTRTLNADSTVHHHARPSADVRAMRSQCAHTPQCADVQTVPEPEPVAAAPVKARKARATRANVRAGILRPVMRADVIDLTAEPMPTSVEPETGSRRDSDGEPDAHGAALAHDFGDPCHCTECEAIARNPEPEPTPAVEPCTPTEWTCADCDGRAYPVPVVSHAVYHVTEPAAILAPVKKRYIRPNQMMRPRHGQRSRRISPRLPEPVTAPDDPPSGGAEGYIEYGPYLCPYNNGHEACTAGAIGHNGAHEYPTVQPCYHYLHTVGVPPIRCDAGLDGHDGAHHYPADALAPEPTARARAADAYATAMYGPVNERKARHGRRLRRIPRRSIAAILGPRNDLSPLTRAELAAIEPAAPVLTIVQPVQRPTCERCGQTFRKSGNGAEWHRVNRPDCAPVLSASA